MTSSISDGKDAVVDLSAHIVKTEEDSVGSGRFGDVYKGMRNDKSVNDSGRMVAIKVIRPITANKDLKLKLLKQLNREIAVWQGLVHKNIVPFLGISNSFGRMPALISLWMDNGRLNDYLAAYPDVDRSAIAEGLACGILYLHTRNPKITHGDIKTANSLVDRDGNPKLCDFGLSRLICEEDLWLTTTVNSRGSVRWMAPELLDGRQILPTSESDVYSFGMTVLEILTGRVPYHHHRNDGTVLLAVAFQKELPSRPTDVEDSRLWQVDMDELWECLKTCWDSDPRRRPTMAVLEELFRSGREEQMLRADVTAEVISSGPFNGHTDAVFSVAFSPDGRRIASGSWDGVRLWNVETGQTVLGPLQEKTQGVFSVAFSPNGKNLIAGCRDNTVRVWDAVKGQVASKPFVGHQNHVRSVAYSPDGKRIVSGSDDRTMRVWNVATGMATAVLKGHTAVVMTVAFSPDGKWIVSCAWDKMMLWDAEEGKAVSGPFKSQEGYVGSATFSPDGMRIAAGYQYEVWVWDIKRRKVVSGPFKGHTNFINSVAFSPDGKRIASGSDDNTVRVWDAVAGELVSGPFIDHTGCVHSVAFSPDGKWIASGSGDCTVRVWNVETESVMISDENPSPPVKSRSKFWPRLSYGR